MANHEQLEILMQGIEVWNNWRSKHPDEKIDLSNAKLQEANLAEADLHVANLIGADLTKANLTGANLTKANLSRANLSMAIVDHAYLNEAVCRNAILKGANFEKSNLSYADLFQADLRQAKLQLAKLSGVDLQESKLQHADLTETILINATLKEADLSEVDLKLSNLSGADIRAANLTNADLRGSNLSETNFVKANVIDVDISYSNVYGVGVWDLKGDFKSQKDLVITQPGEPAITVDNIKVAQFIYLILNNQEIRDVLNTLTSKTVLILGRFSLPERKRILDALRNKLREYDLLPIVFDFERPTDKDFTETIKTLAGMCYFVIADVTNPKSSPLELQATIPDYQIPFAPIIQEGEYPFAMMVDLQKKYKWVLKTVSYDSEETLMKVLKPLIIDPAMKKRQELRLIKAQEPEVISGKDFLDSAKE